MTFSIHDTWEYIKNLFVTNSHKVADFLKPYWSEFETQGKVILIDAAKSAVQVGKDTPGDGIEKMQAALAAFAATVIAEGLTYAESEARLLIETALQNDKIASAATTPQATV